MKARPKSDSLDLIRTNRLVRLLVIPWALSALGCTHQGGAKQKEAFSQAVAFEKQTQSIPDREAAYMAVIGMDPNTEYGKAASDRVAQLNSQMQAILGVK